MIRTASLIAAFLFFTARARGRRHDARRQRGLEQFLLVGAFFLDGLANAAEQLCGHAYGAATRRLSPAGEARRQIWGFGFALAVAACFLGSGRRSST